MKLFDLSSRIDAKRADKNKQNPEPSTLTVDSVRRTLAERGVYRVNGPEDLIDVTEYAVKESADNPVDVELLRKLQREFSGLGVLAEVLTDSLVTDVLVNPDGTVWIDRGGGLDQASTPRLEPSAIRELAVQLAARCGVRLDNSMPFADGVLTNLPAEIPAQAIRVHAALSPPVQGGASISLRTLSARHNSVADLVETGMMPPAIGDLLRRLVQRRKNILISGGTGAGKTTLLTALLGEVPDSQRMIIVEDTPEIMAVHPHALSLTARRANAEGAGDISMGNLVKQCLRMRPDRIIVGEIRGAEIADLLVALNTGHAGSSGTIHANSPDAVPSRLEALGAMANMTTRSLVKQAFDGIDLIVHVARTPQGRMVTHLSTLVGVDTGAADPQLQVETLWASENPHCLDGLRTWGGMQ